MTDYQIQPNTRRCTISGRELRPGEKYYTALVEEGLRLVRHDYSPEAWQGPPPGAFSFWCGRVPAGDEPRKPRFDDDLLVDCFGRLEGAVEPSKISFRYVVALLLMRRKRFHFEEAKLLGDREVLCLRCQRTGAQFEVVNPRLSDAEMLAAQDEVFKVLGWE